MIDQATGSFRRHILVVDDATVVRMYYRQILEDQGYEVAEAINGIEALERTTQVGTTEAGSTQTPFDLCVVDVNMPLMDGYAFIRAMRRDPATHGIPALMTSTEAGPQDRLAARIAGANAYLVKPVAREQLARYVAAILGRPRA